MGIAAHVYTLGNEDTYPIAYRYEQIGEKFNSIAWDLTTTYVGNQYDVKPGLLWEGHGAVKVQQCPSFHGAANWGNDPYTGYNYNTSYIGHGEYESIQEPAKTVSILRPSNTALFGDGQYAGGANKFMRAPWPNPGDESFKGRNAGTQGFRHLGSTAVAFCDHIIRARTTPVILPSLLCDYMRSGYVRTIIEERIVSAAGQNTISQPSLSDILIPIPPYEEQIRQMKAIEKTLSYIRVLEDSKGDLSSLIENAKSRILDLAIHGQLVPQSPDDEPASVLLERIRAEKEELIKQGKIKLDKRESVIFRGEDNSYYEKVGNKELICVDDELPFAIPDGWAWCELQDCCHKEIKRGRSPKYADSGRVLSFAQKCNQKTGTINIGLALWIDDSTVSRYDDEEYMRDSDIVINSTGTGTLGRVGIYQNTDNPEGIPIVPDSHVTVVRVSDNLDPTYVFYYLKSMQSALEKMGEGSTNQKELKPISLQQLRIPIPPNQEQKRIVSVVDTMLGKLELVETNLI